MTANPSTLQARNSHLLNGRDGVITYCFQRCQCFVIDFESFERRRCRSTLPQSNNRPCCRGSSLIPHVGYPILQELSAGMKMSYTVPKRDYISLVFLNNVQHSVHWFWVNKYILSILNSMSICRHKGKQWIYNLLQGFAVEPQWLYSKRKQESLPMSETREDILKSILHW